MNNIIHVTGSRLLGRYQVLTIRNACFDMRGQRTKQQSNLDQLKVCREFTLGCIVT